MGELFLVLILTCIICGGVPLLAFGVINGKIKLFNQNTSVAEKTNRRIMRWMALILGTFFGCFMFPVYNFTKNYDNSIHWYGLFSAIGGYWIISAILAKAFPYEQFSIAKTIFTLLGFNSIHVFAGMGCRYLLEYGEVSNTYNFSVINIVFHLLAVNVFCLSSCYFIIKQGQS